MSRHVYKLKPDPMDHRDRVFLPNVANVGTLPASVDLRGQCPPIYDQGELGSCTANAIAASLDTMHKASGASDFFGPSRLFIYWNERDMEGTVSDDAGACIRDGIKSVNSQGACREITWPYDPDEMAVKPSDAAYAEALNFEAVAYRRVVPLPMLFKAALAAGLPVVFGMSVYESFESDAVAQSGIVPMPDIASEQCLGGHAVCAVGYNDLTANLLVRNSWGTAWGASGHFLLPYAFLARPGLVTDAWAISKAE